MSKVGGDICSFHEKVKEFYSTKAMVNLSEMMSISTKDLSFIYVRCAEFINAL